jgi:drug/metabolite transporter (DMT)-like permease
MAALFIFVILLMRIIQSVFSKKGSLKLPSGKTAYIHYIFLQFASSSLFSLIVMFGGKIKSETVLPTLAVAACSGCFLAFNMLCGIKALDGGTVVLNSIFSTSGIIIPCALGALFLNESMSLIQVFCIAAVIFSAVLLVDSSKKVKGTFTPETLLWLLGSFAANGAVMFCQKVFGLKVEGGNVAFFSMLTFLIPAIMLGGAFIVLGLKSRKTESEKQSEFPKPLYLYAVLLAFAVFVIQQLATTLTPMLSSAVLFAWINGGATIIAAIVGAVVFGEKITVKTVIGITVGIAALVLI